MVHILEYSVQGGSLFLTTMHNSELQYSPDVISHDPTEVWLSYCIIVCKLSTQTIQSPGLLMLLKLYIFTKHFLKITVVMNDILPSVRAVHLKQGCLNTRIYCITMNSKGITV